MGGVFLSLAGGPPMDERDSQDPFRDLGERLDEARRRRQSARDSRPDDDGAAANRDALGLAFRIGLELVVAVGVGVGVGWALDQWLGTRPWGMIVLLFLGFGAGMWNVYRAVTGMGMAMGTKRSKPDQAEHAKDTGWSDEDED